MVATQPSHRGDNARCSSAAGRRSLEDRHRRDHKQTKSGMCMSIWGGQGVVGIINSRKNVGQRRSR